MKVAATYDNGKIFQHFGQARSFKVYEISENTVLSSKTISSGTYSHETLSELLRQNEVEMLICGGIGKGAIEMLNKNGITVFPGISGDPDDAIADFMVDKLKASDDPTCDHAHKCTCH